MQLFRRVVALVFPNRKSVQEVLRTEVIPELKGVKASVARIETAQDKFKIEVKTALAKVETAVANVATVQGTINEFLCKPPLDKEFGALLGEERTLRTADDVARVVVPESVSTKTGAAFLISGLGVQDKGFFSVLKHSVGKLLAFAMQPGAEPEVMAAASALQAMDVAGLVAGGRQASTALEATLPVVKQLHRSGVGRVLFARDLEEYVKASPAQREALLAGAFFMPCLSAAATGTALEELQLDRCARMEVQQHDSPFAKLAVSELKLTSRGYGDARSQLVRSGTILAWAYHALRRSGRLEAQLPEVMDVQAHIFASLEDPTRQQLKRLAMPKRVADVSGQGTPLTIYFFYYRVTPNGVKRLVV